jgi:orotidine-5'-phosphate decarboxylase
MQNIDEKLIVALDVETLEQAKHFVDILYPRVKLFKVGSQLFTACGPEAVKMIGEKGGKVFLDLKFHDIPNTVYLATSSGSASCIQISKAIKRGGVQNTITPPVFMMTVHTKGGREMLEEAARGAKEKAEELNIVKPYVVGVTRLTSDPDTADIAGQVLGAVKLAKDAGLDGVVCAVSEAQKIRKEFGKDFIIVTPGIRSKGAKINDQKRVATAEEAIAAGADYLVVGRPILEAKDPLMAAQEIISSHKQA